MLPGDGVGQGEDGDETRGADRTPPDGSRVRHETPEPRIGVPMTPPFHVEWTDHGEIRSVRAVGEIDIATVEEFRRALDCDLPILDIDLSRVEFIDLAGLDCLLDTVERQASVMLTTSPRVDRLLELTGTGHVFDRR